MTRKISSILSFIACITLFALTLKAQNAADIGVESTLEEEIIATKRAATINTSEEKIAPKVDVATQKVNVPAPSNTKETIADNATKKQAKIEKFLDSKLGQWVVKRATISMHKKQIRQNLKTFEGDKAAKKAYKEDLQKEVLKTKAMNSNVRTGIILIAVGIILTILPVDILQVVGYIVIVIGLVFLILGLI